MDNNSEAVRQDATAVKQQIIAELEKAFERIATNLKVSVDIVRNIAHRRRACLPKGARKNREAAVQKLREQGLPNADIADTLGMSLMAVMHIIKKLLSEGKINPRPRGNFISEEKLRERKEKVLELRRKKYSSEEIAAMIGVGINAVKDAITELINEGKIESYQTMKKEEISQRRKKIIALRNVGCSNPQIATALELPYHVVADMAHKLIGEGVISRQPRGKKPST